MRSISILFFILLIITPVFSITGYVRYAEQSWCMDECSIYYLEDEYGEFLTWVTHLENIDMLALYTNRFVELEGPDVWCVECGAIDINTIEISDECEFPVECFADPCTIEFCPEFPEAECIPNYCEGCWADFYLDGEWLDCNSQIGCVDLNGIDFGDCDMFIGVGWITDHCEDISGCDWVVDGIDYSNAFFDSMDECYEVCENSPPSGTVTYTIHSDWNLVGLPLEVNNSSYQILFPEAIEGTLYSFDGGYNSEENLNPGTGYWLRFPSNGTVIVTGNHIFELTISLSQGWNLISGISQPIDVNNIYDPNNIIVQGTFYGFVNGYVEASQLIPGESYWVRANQSGIIIVNE